MKFIWLLCIIAFMISCGNNKTSDVKSILTKEEHDSYMRNEYSGIVEDEKIKVLDPTNDPNNECKLYSVKEVLDLALSKDRKKWLTEHDFYITEVSKREKNSKDEWVVTKNSKVVFSKCRLVKGGDGVHMNSVFMHRFELKIIPKSIVSYIPNTNGKIGDHPQRKTGNELYKISVAYLEKIGGRVSNIEGIYLFDEYKVQVLNNGQVSVFFNKSK